MSKLEFALVGIILLFIVIIVIVGLYQTVHSINDDDGSRGELGVVYKVIYDGRLYETANYSIDEDGTLTFDTWYKCYRTGCYREDSSLIMPLGTYIIEVRHENVD